MNPFNICHVLKCLLLEVILPYLALSKGGDHRLACRNFLEGRGMFHFPCSYRSTCYIYIYLSSLVHFLTFFLS